MRRIDCRGEYEGAGEVGKLMVEAFETVRAILRPAKVGTVFNSGHSIVSTSTVFSGSSMVPCARDGEGSPLVEPNRGSANGLISNENVEEGVEGGIRSRVRAGLRVW